ncbi:MAG: hypothetical protein V3W18_03820 [candidate division Zixibacteria bacterium]
MRLRDNIVTVNWLWQKIIILGILLFASTMLLASDNSCSLGEVIVIDDNSISVEIQISNTDTLAGFQIPFSFSYGEIEVNCDSLVYAGAACEDFASAVINIDNDNQMVYFAAIDNVMLEDNNTPLLPGINTIAIAYFSFDQINQNQNLTFQKTIIPDDYRDYSLLMWTPDSEDVLCSFEFNDLNIR